MFRSDGPIGIEDPPFKSSHVTTDRTTFSDSCRSGSFFGDLSLRIRRARWAVARIASDKSVEFSLHASIPTLR